MWKNVNGRLVHTTDAARAEFKTSISKKILKDLNNLADEHDTYINYLLETGIQAILDDNYIEYDKALRPKDRIHYRTTYDKELLIKLKLFAHRS